jgi:hypothetical protein
MKSKSRELNPLCGLEEAMSNITVRKVSEQRPVPIIGLRMERLSVLTLIFALLSLVFFILLVFFKSQFPLYPLMSYQDAFDILTPVVLIPLYWILFRYAAREAPGLIEEIVFLVLAAFWVEGQGMHLSSNSISNLMEALSRSGLVDLNANDIFNLTYFYDERLGHYLWHIGVLGLAGLLVFREWRHPVGEATAWWLTVPAGLIYGFFLFAITNEGQTVWMGLPFSILVSFLGLVWGRSRLRQQPVLAFFLVACVFASLLYAGWGLYWGGFPGFFDVGIL